MELVDCPDDDAILAFLGQSVSGARGATSSTVRPRLAGHFEQCDRCRELLTDLARATVGERRLETRGGMEGRYVLLSALGAGAMGVVQAAFDRQLDRKVALKFLSATPGEDSARAQARLQREAQALAKLAHPNVVTVHEVGVLDAEVYVAMELVEGSTLREWLGSRARGLREVLEIMRQAGEGLAAAHAAGLVHRDFKPDNVLVGDDGRVRVTDFGLARSAMEADEGVASNGGGARPVATLTETGVLAGTPAYMAPEQRAGEAPSHRSDIYSFCVTLHEAVTGARPGDPAARRPPGWLARAIARGLRARSDERWPTMRALLDTLARGPRVTPARLGAAVGVVALALVAGLTARERALASRAPPRCPTPDHAFDGIWADTQREAVERALRASGREASLPYVLRALDDYAGAWSRAEVANCTATRVRGEQSERLLDLRMACLDDRRRSLDRTVSLLAKADADVATRSVEMASGLPGVETCEKVRSLEEIGAPPAGAEGVVADAKLALDDGRALFYAGKPREARARIEPAIADITKIGYAPLLGQLLFWRGTIERDLSSPRACEESLRAAAVQSIEGRDDATLAQIWTLFSLQIAERRVEARAWADQAGAVIQRLGGDDELEGERLLSLGAIVPERSEAQATLLRARELLVRTRGADFYLIASIDQRLGNVALEDGRVEDAVRDHARALALRMRLFGIDHPATVSSIFNVAEDALARKRPAEARDALRELGGRVAQHDPMERAWYERKLHDIARAEDDSPRALEHSRAAAALYGAAKDPDDRMRAYALGDVGGDLLDLHRPKDAIAPLEEAARLLAPFGDTSVVDLWFDLGRAYFDSGERARGRSLVEKARATYVKSPDATDPDMLAEANAWLKKHG